MCRTNTTPKKNLSVNAYHVGIVSNITVTCDINHTPEISPTKCDYFYIKRIRKRSTNKIVSW